MANMSSKGILDGEAVNFEGLNPLRSVYLIRR